MPPTGSELRAKAKTAADRLQEALEHELSDSESPGTKLHNLIWGKTSSIPYDPQADVTALTGNEPVTYKTAADGIKNILQPGQGDGFAALKKEFDNTGRTLNEADWSSEAADSFRRNFLDAYTDVAANQCQVAKELAQAAEGYHQALEATFTGIDQALTKAIEKAEEIIKEAGVNRREFILGVLGAFAGVGVMVATLPISGAGSIVLLGVAQAISTVGPPTSKILFDGGNAKETCDDLKEALGKIKTDLDKVDAALAGGLNTDLAKIGDSKPGSSAPEYLRTEFELPRPAFADDPGKL